MSLRDKILHNFWLKVFSVILAMMIWFAIQSNLQTEAKFPQSPFRPVETRDFRRPIAISTSATNQLVFKIEPSHVSVKIRGDRSFVRKLNLSDIQVYVDLTDVRDVHGSFPIQVHVPREVGLYEVWPSRVHVETASPK